MQELGVRAAGYTQSPLVIEGEKNFLGGVDEFFAWTRKEFGFSDFRYLSIALQPAYLHATH